MLITCDTLSLSSRLSKRDTNLRWRGASITELPIENVDSVLLERPCFVGRLTHSNDSSRSVSIEFLREQNYLSVECQIQVVLVSTESHEKSRVFRGIP